MPGPLVKPIAWNGGTTGRRTVDRRHPIVRTRYGNFPAGDDSVAQNADALVVERVPFPPCISRAENREFIVRKERCDHLIRKLRLERDWAWFENRPRR